jgi:hypothetical protein
MGRGVNRAHSADHMRHTAADQTDQAASIPLTSGSPGAGIVLAVTSGIMMWVC